MAIPLSVLWSNRSPFIAFKSQRSASILLCFQSASYLQQPSPGNRLLWWGWWGGVEGWVGGVLKACAHFLFLRLSVLLSFTVVTSAQPPVSSVLTDQVSFLTWLLGSYRKFSSSSLSRKYTHFLYWSMSTSSSGLLNPDITDTWGQRILCCEWGIEFFIHGDCPVCCRMFNSISGLYPLDISSIPSPPFQHQYFWRWWGGKTGLCWDQFWWWIKWYRPEVS